MSGTKKIKLYLVLFKTGGYTFAYARSLNEIKELLLENYGEDQCSQIDWNSLVSGKQAEEIIKLYRSLGQYER